MKKSILQNIDLGVLGKELRQYENKWVAISGESKIVSSGSTYAEAVRKTSSKDSVVLFKVPPLGASLAPSA